MKAEQAVRISEICDRFEWDCVKGAAPQIERVLSEARPEDRPHLVEHLLRIELEMRRRNGEHPRAADYAHRLRDHAERVERVLAEETDDAEETTRRVVGRYTLLEEIGRGYGGVVYRAIEDGIVPSVVAVKLLRVEAVASRPDALRFVQEARALARIEHPHIVPYRGSGEDRGQLYYVMRYLSGSDLAHFMAERRGPLPPLEAARLMIPVADAVAHLHSQRPAVVHRDLKPHNILLDEAGHPYISDFGLAILFGDGDGDGDGDGEWGGACGTVPYIAPEQFARRFGEVGPASDIYSLGVILYELIVGRPPFPRARASILRSLDSEPTRPCRLAPGISNDLERICLKCLRKATGQRYQSAAVLAAELRRFEQNQPLLQTPPDAAWQRTRHWARSEPALAARLAVIIACSTIMWGYHVVTGTYAPLLPGHWATRPWAAAVLTRLGPIEVVLVWMNQWILAFWGLASWAFQQRLTRERNDGGLQLGWRLVDVVSLCLLIQLDDALMSPLTVAFAVLIVASAFWERADQILQTTLLSMAGYILLAVIYHVFHPGLDRLYRHFHFLVGLAFLGLMLISQANRTRALARVCGTRDRS